MIALLGLQLTMEHQSLPLQHTQLLHLLDSLSDPLLTTNAADIVKTINPAAAAILDDATIGTAIQHILIPDHWEVTHLTAIESGGSIYKLSQTADASPENNRQPGSTAFQVIDYIHTGILIFDKQNHVVALNPMAAKIIDKPREDVITKHYARVLPTLDYQWLATYGAPPKMISHANRFYMVLALPVLQYEGYKLIVLIDAAQAQSGEHGLLRMVIHDLSNPLNVALNYLLLLRDESATTKEFEDGIKTAIKHMAQMRDLLKDLAAIEQISSGMVAESFTEVDLDILAATVINELKPAANKEDIALHLNALPDCDCTTIGNERLLQQAIRNLTENAIKYTRPGGWVRMTLRKTPQHTEVIISDNGIGISPKQSNRLFTPFYRAANEKAPAVSGMGLGLSLVKMVAEQHNGQVWMHSTPGKGSQFVFQLPVNP